MPRPTHLYYLAVGSLTATIKYPTARPTAEGKKDVIVGRGWDWMKKTHDRALARWRQAGPKAVSVLVSPRLKTKTLTACLHFSKHCLEKTSLKLGCVFFFSFFPRPTAGARVLNIESALRLPRAHERRKRKNTRSTLHESNSLAAGS